MIKTLDELYDATDKEVIETAKAEGLKVYSIRVEFAALDFEQAKSFVTNDYARMGFVVEDSLRYEGDNDLLIRKLNGA